MTNSSHLAWSFPPKLLAVVWGDGLSAEFENWQHTSISPPRYKTKQKPPSVCGFGLTGWMFLFRGSGAHWNIYFQTILLSHWRDIKLIQFLPNQVSQKCSRWNIPSPKECVLTMPWLNEWFNFADKNQWVFCALHYNEVSTGLHHSQSNTLQIMSEQLPALENTSSYGQCFLYSKPRPAPTQREKYPFVQIFRGKKGTRGNLIVFTLILEQF